MQQLAFEIKERGTFEKSKHLRKNGEIPGIIYGEFLEEPISVKIQKSNLTKLLKSNSKGSIFNLKLNDISKTCVLKHLQKDNITGELIHVDFQYVKENEVIKMKIPVNYEGIENLVSKRLFLETLVSELEMQGNVEKIPEFIKIDVSQMGINDKLFVKDIKLPEEVKLLTEPDMLLAFING